MRHTVVAVRNASFIVIKLLKNILGHFPHVGPNGFCNGEHCAMQCENNLYKMQITVSLEVNVFPQRNAARLLSTANTTHISQELTGT